MNRFTKFILAAVVIWLGVCPVAYAADLTDAEIENIVRRSHQYVAMYNVNNKFAMK